MHVSLRSVTFDSIISLTYRASLFLYTIKIISPPTQLKQILSHSSVPQISPHTSMHPLLDSLSCLPNQFKPSWSMHFCCPLFTLLDVWLIWRWREGGAGDGARQLKWEKKKEFLGITFSFPFFSFQVRVVGFLIVEAWRWVPCVCWVSLRVEEERVWVGGGRQEVKEWEGERKEGERKKEWSGYICETERDEGTLVWK